jgi:hypothetical protein
LRTGTKYENVLKSGTSAISFDKDEYATIVIGSGPEGIASALASARTGLKTLLITQDSDLGGYIKKSMIVKMDPQNGNIENKKVPLNQGIYEEIFGNFTTGFSGDDYKKAVTDLAGKEKSLEIIYNSRVTGVNLVGGSLKGIMVDRQDGQKSYKAKNYIDATQDGQLLTLCNTPYFKGSADVGIQNFYSPLEFNFKVSGVDTEALRKSQKTTNFIDDFQLALLSYKKSNSGIKILSPSFIILNEGELVISGIKAFNVNVEDMMEMEEAYKTAEDEARMLTAFLKSVLSPFKDCKYEGGPEAFFIPEYRHFEGRYRLTVSDILENRNFENKIALCSAPVDAGKFSDKSLEYIVAKPDVYSIPLGSIIPSNLDNVMMTGAKASFTSLAATSAGNIPTGITIGESAGLVSAFSCINNITPADLLKAPEGERKALNSYLKHGDIKLADFSESIFIPGTEEKLSDNWAYPYVKTLAEYGLITGGTDNNFKLGYKASQELLAVLIRNAIIKMAPDHYDMDLDKKLETFETKEELTGEKAGTIVLEALSIPYKKGSALETLKQKAILPVDLTDRLEPEKIVTMDAAYGLSVETMNAMNR